MTGARVVIGATLVVLVLSGCATGVRSRTQAQRAAPAPEPRSERVEAERPDPAPTKPAPSPDQLRLEQQVTRIAGEMSELENALAKVIATSRQHEGQLQSLDRRVGEVAARSRDGVGSAPVGFAPPAAGPTPPAGSSSTTITTPANDLYGEGLAKFREGAVDAAVLKFYELIATYPTHPLREAAQVQVADIFLSQKDFRGALAELESLIAALPRGAKTPDTLLKIGRCQRGLGQEREARKVWERLIKEYPNSAAARQAHVLLRSPRRG